MSDQKKTGNENMPAFEHLTDRVINEPTSSPIFVMKTNLDTDDVSSNNPYFEDTDGHKNNPYYKDTDVSPKDRETLENFFKED